MKKIDAPEYVDIGPHRFSVSYAQADMDRIRVEHESSCVGRMLRDLTRIVIDPAMSVSQQRGTLIHELLHAIVSNHGGWFSTKAEPMSEERAILLLEGGLLDLLRRNPRLIAWLTSEAT